MKKIALFSILACLATVAAAQPNMPLNPVPLDGGLSLLIAAGAAYGASRWKKQKNKP